MPRGRLASRRAGTGNLSRRFLCAEVFVDQEFRRSKTISWVGQPAGVLVVLKCLVIMTG